VHIWRANFLAIASETETPARVCAKQNNGQQLTAAALLFAYPGGGAVLNFRAHLQFCGEWVA